MNKRIRWGILATGAIAQAFARGVKASQTGELVAVGSRSLDKAQTFGKNFGIANCHGTYQELLGDPTVEAVYICTPHPQHAEWSIKAAEAGKQLYLDKPLCSTLQDAHAIVAAVRKAGVTTQMFTQVHWGPATRMRRLVDSGTLGELTAVHCDLSFAKGQAGTAEPGRARREDPQPQRFDPGQHQ